MKPLHLHLPLLLASAYLSAVVLHKILLSVCVISRIRSATEKNMAITSHRLSTAIYTLKIWYWWWHVIRCHSKQEEVTVWLN